jgi:hypothetical protein
LGSLTAHLLEEGDHGRLGFHPRCPVCRRERLYGSLPIEPVISRRVQAAIAAGALAFSAAGPSVAAAQEPDYQQEGVVAPEQSVGTAPGQQSSEATADDPAFDPGTDPDGDDALPLEAETPEAAPLADEDAYYAAPVEPEPVDDPYAGGLVPDESEPEASPSEEAPVPPVEAAPVVPAPAPPSDPVTVESPTTEVEAPATQNAPDAPDSRGDRSSTDTPKTEDEARKAEQRSGTGREPRLESAPVVAAPHGAPVTIAAPAVGVVPATASPTAASGSSSSTNLASNNVGRAPASTPTDQTPREARFHVVQPGESLWSIAKKLLGPSATPAQIAREVNRLWELNKDRIATGNPDLLMAGVKLRLR